MNEYISYEDLMDYAGIEPSAASTTDVKLLRNFCTWASREFEREAGGRLFYPRTATLTFDHSEDDTTVLVLDDDLLAVSTFTTNNTSTEVEAADYKLMCGETYNRTPYDRIALKSDGSQSNLLYSGTVQEANSVAGTWGWHDDWSNAWQDSGDTVQDAGGINATVTSVTVTDADGADIYGMTPRFRVQDTLKIGTEYLYVTAKNTTTNILTVRRGVSGTTAAVHANAAAISVYQPPGAVTLAMHKLAIWLYRQKDTTGGEADRPLLAGDGSVIMPSELPAHVVRIARSLRRMGSR